MTKYTDEDVQNLVLHAKGTVRALIVNDCPNTARMIAEALKPFETDPWEQLTAFADDNICSLHNTDDLKAIIDKAAELGIVKRVED